MLGTVVAISVIGVLGAVAEICTNDKDTQDFIWLGTIGISGALVVGSIVHLIKSIYK